MGPYFGCWGSLLGPYFTKKGVLIGSLSQRLGVLISFGGSAIPLYTTHRYMCEKLTRCLLGLEAHISIFLHRCLDRHSFKSQTTDVCVAIFLTHHFQLANSNEIFKLPIWPNCKSLPFFYFPTFEKGRLLYIHPVGWLVGGSVG